MKSIMENQTLNAEQIDGLHELLIDRFDINIGTNHHFWLNKIPYHLVSIRNKEINLVFSKILQSYHYDHTSPYHNDNIGVENLIKNNYINRLEDVTNLWNHCPLTLDEIYQ
jgi:hypothetical protein